MTWTEASVTRRLAHHFNYGKNLIVPNYGKGLVGWEADLVVVRPSGWAIEVEVKISIADLKAEFKHKVEKHRRLLNGVPQIVHEPWNSRASRRPEDIEDWAQYDAALAANDPSDYIIHSKQVTSINDWRQPSKHYCKEFWFALPIELIEKAMPIIPDYAGVLSLEEDRWDAVQVVQRATPLPMAQKVDGETRAHMMQCMYFRFWNFAIRHQEALSEPVQSTGNLCGVS